MSCSYEENIPAYLQGELSPPATRRFEEHLAGCLTCPAELQETQDLLKKMKGVFEEPVRVNFAARIMQTIAFSEWEKTSTPLHAESPDYIGVKRDARGLADVLDKSEKLSRVYFVAAGLLLGLLAFWFIIILKQENSHHNFSKVDRPVLTNTAEEPLPLHIVQAVDTALDWLSRAQEPEGYWDTKKWGGDRKYEIGLTALAALSFIPPKETDYSNVHQTVLTNAIDFLVRQQNGQGLFGPDFNGAMYNHGLATVALLEYDRVNKNRNLRRPIQKALTYIQQTQKPAGGWGYTRDLNEPPNTAISFWPLQALVLASKYERNGIKPSLERGINWFRQTCDAKGQPGYHRPSEFPYGSETLMAMGAFNYFYQAKQKFAVPPDAYESFRQEFYQEANRLIKRTNYYGWYFLSYALYAEGGRPAEQKRQVILNALIETQNKTAPDGIGTGIYTGSWEPADRWGDTGGRVYATALAALILETESRARGLR